MNEKAFIAKQAFLLGNYSRSLMDGKITDPYDMTSYLYELWKQAETDFQRIEKSDENTRA